MTVNRTTLLDLPLPVTGTESGTWGDTTNNGLTQYLDIAIAGTLVLSTDADVTLTSTEGDSSATNIGATTAQYAILRWTATGSTTRNITALAQSKTYVVINATGGTQSIVLRGAGPTTGVTIISGEKALCVWNGSDFVKVSSSAAAGGSNTQVQYNSSGVLAGSSNLTFDGTSLTLGGNPTLSAGTANGVLYLNGSKVATSGSALTFDGSTLTETNATSAANLVLNNTVSGKQTYINLTSGATVLNSVYRPATTNDFQFDANYGSIVWGIGSAGTATEGMRLTSTGLGIGTSSPSRKLTVVSGSSGVTIATAAGALFENSSHQYIYSVTPANFQNALLFGGGSDNDAGLIWEDGTRGNYFNCNINPSTGYWNWTHGATERMRLDSSGNLGLGVTPSAWGSNFKALQIADGVSLIGRVGISRQDLMSLSSNSYFNGTNYIYIGSRNAAMYSHDTGQHQWYTAPSGTAGNAITFTQAMTLDASGRLGIGTTSPGVVLQTALSSASGTIGNASTYLGLGGSEDAAGALHLIGFGYFGSSQNYYPSYIGSVNTSGAGYTKNALVFYTRDVTTDTAPSERARIDSSGNLGVGTTSPSGLGKIAAYQTADATALYARCTNATLTTGAILDVEADRNTTNNTFYVISYVNNGASAYKFRVADSGDVTNTNNSYGAISDVKTKQDIVDAASQWDDLKGLRVRKFRYKNDPTAPLQIGLVAQEAETVSPGLIDEHPDYEEVEVTDEEGNVKTERQLTGTSTKSVKYSVLYMKAIKALQEAMARIETLEAKVSALEGN